MTGPLTLPPAAADAMADPEVRKSPTLIVVYWYCLGYLTVRDFKRMRVLDVADTVGKRRARVGDAMRWLVANGYLIRGPKVADRTTYKLAEHRSVVRSVPFQRAG